MPPTPPDPAALQPVAAFRAALRTAADQARKSRAQRPERVQAIAALTETDLARLTDHFAALLRGPADIGALTSALHAELRALAPEQAPREEDADA